MVVRSQLYIEFLMVILWKYKFSVRTNEEVLGT